MLATLGQGRREVLPGRIGDSMSAATPSKVSLGFSGLFASVGDHIGHFSTSDWKDCLVPFLEAGLQEGDVQPLLSRR